MVGRDGAERRVEQGRVRGISRAVLDGFQVVRWGGGSGERTAGEQEGAAVEGGKAVELDHVEVVDQGRASNDSEEDKPRPAGQTLSGAVPIIPLHPTPSTIDPAPVPSPVTVPAIPPVPATSVPLPSSPILPLATTAANPVAEDDELETCPICVCAFEDGDEIRILPCHHQHRFHTECVDPYLLQFSSLCPLCRLDLRGTAALPADGAAVAAGPGAEGVRFVADGRVRPRLAGLRAVWAGRNAGRVGRRGTGAAAVAVAEGQTGRARASGLS